MRECALSVLARLRSPFAIHAQPPPPANGFNDSRRAGFVGRSHSVDRVKVAADVLSAGMRRYVQPVQHAQPRSMSGSAACTSAQLVQPRSARIMPDDADCNVGAGSELQRTSTLFCTPETVGWRGLNANRERLPQALRGPRERIRVQPPPRPGAVFRRNVARASTESEMNT